MPKLRSFRGPSVILVASLALSVQARGDPHAPNNFSNLEEWFRADTWVTLAAGNNVSSWEGLISNTLSQPFAGNQPSIGGGGGFTHGGNTLPITACRSNSCLSPTLTAS